MTSQTAAGRSRAGALATGTPAETVLRVSDLRMNYGSTEVLKGVDLTARRGEVIALLGPNGAGKTTTVEILEGFRRRSAGEVDVLGSDPDHGDEEWRSRLGVVLQSWRDHGAWRVRDLLHHFGRYYAPYAGPDRVRPHDTDSPHTPLLLRWGIKTKTNDQIRQEFLNEHVPELLEAGLLPPDPHLRYDEKTGNWVHGPIPWDEFWKVIQGEGPMNRHRLLARRRAHEEGRWVREAMEAHARRRLAQAAD